MLELRCRGTGGRGVEKRHGAEDKTLLGGEKGGGFVSVADGCRDRR